MPAWSPLLTLLPRSLGLLGALAIWLGALDLASAQAPYDDARAFSDQVALYPAAAK